MTNPNDSAFAHWSPSGQQAGLTKREYFAAMCLQGILSNKFSTHSPQEAIKNWYISEDHAAEVAENYADALIARLNKEGQADS